MFQLQAKVGETQTVYQLKLEAKADNPFVAEELSVDHKALTESYE